MPEAPARVAVRLHGVSAASQERCALIRDWLDDHGVKRVTLMLACGEPDAALAKWLDERRAAGDAVAPEGPRGARGSARPGRRLAMLRDGVLWLDLHPSELAARRRVAAVERLLRRASVPA